MTAKGPTKRSLAMIAAYQDDKSLAEVGSDFGVTMQAVHHAIKAHAPQIMRPVGKQLKKTRQRNSKQVEFPHAGPPGDELYRVGACLDCHIPLMSYTPKAVDYCGFCEAARNAA